MPQRPTKAWFERCTSKVRAKMKKGKPYSPEAVCASVWHKKSDAEKTAIAKKEYGRAPWEVRHRNKHVSGHRTLNAAVRKAETLADQYHGEYFMVYNRISGKKHGAAFY
jgi:hypothetical protein